MIVTTITNSSGHQLAQVQVGATNYIEAGSNIAMATTNHQRQVAAGQLTRSICRQHYNAQVATPVVAPTTSHQNQANLNHWPTMVAGDGSDQWSASHKFHMNQDHNCCHKSTNEGNFYDYLQVKFSTPTVNHYQENSRPGAKTDEFMAQQHSYQVNDADHPNHHYDQQLYYNPPAVNQVQVNYNVANVYNSNQNRAYQQDTVRDRCHQPIPTYHGNQTYNQAASLPSQPSITATSFTSSESCLPSSSLYNGHQNFTSPLKAQAAVATNRFSFGDFEGKCRQINITEPTGGGVWVSQTQYQDYGLRPQVDSIQIHDQAHHWPAKVAVTSVRAQSGCHGQTNGYDYYGLECGMDETNFTMNKADTIRPTACDQQIFRKDSASSSLSMGNYRSNDTTRSSLDTTNSSEFKQATVNRNIIEAKPRCLPVFNEISVVPSRRPEGVELEQHPIKTTQFELKDKIPSVGTTKNYPNIAERLNQCHICGRNYARPSTLKTHLRTHTNERPYKCAVCRKTFSQAANLTAHQRVHTGERPFPCPICGRQFSQSSSVITHLRTHSGERPYRCNMCNRTFSDSSTLTKHCRIHSGEKPYQCDHCPMNFSQSGNLSRHLRLHSIGMSLNKTHQATATAATTAAATNATRGSNAVASSAPSTTSTANQRKHSTNSSSSPESTLSNYSVSSRISSGAGNSTSSRFSS